MTADKDAFSEIIEKYARHVNILLKVQETIIKADSFFEKHLDDDQDNVSYSVLEQAVINIKHTLNIVGLDPDTLITIYNDKHISGDQEAKHGVVVALLRVYLVNKAAQTTCKELSGVLEEAMNAVHHDKDIPDHVNDDINTRLKHLRALIGGLNDQQEANQAVASCLGDLIPESALNILGVDEDDIDVLSFDESDSGETVLETQLQRAEDKLQKATQE